MTVDSQIHEPVAPSSEKRQAMKSFWGMYEGAPTVESMMLNKDAGSFTNEDMGEILAVLPDLRGARVVEFGAGIGRFTGHLAENAADLLTTDFISSFIDENRKRHAHLTNIRYQVNDAMGVHLPPLSVDFVFTNWLMMYLTDQETVEFLRNCLDSLAPAAQMHIRESCTEPSTKHAKKSDVENPTYYRHISQYVALLRSLRVPKAGGGAYGFRVEWAKSVATYITVSANWRQVHMILTKVELGEGKALEASRLEELLVDGSEQADSDARYAALLQALKGNESPLQDLILGAAKEMDGESGDGVFSLFSEGHTASVLPQTLSKELGKGVVSLRTSSLQFSSSIGHANSMAFKNVRFYWVPSAASDARKWEVPKDAFGLCVGSGLLTDENSIPKVLDNIRTLLTADGSLVSLEKRRRDDVHTFAEELSQHGFTDVRVKDVTESARSALKAAVQSATGADFLSATVDGWKEASKFDGNWLIVSAKRN